MYLEPSFPMHAVCGMQHAECSCILSLAFTCICGMLLLIRILLLSFAFFAGLLIVALPICEYKPRPCYCHIPCRFMLKCAPYNLLQCIICGMTWEVEKQMDAMSDEDTPRQSGRHPADESAMKERPPRCLAPGEAGGSADIAFHEAPRRQLASGEAGGSADIAPRSERKKRLQKGKSDDEPCRKKKAEVATTTCC